jgi:hypothetical protein
MDWTTGIRFPAVENISFLHSVQTGLGVNTASYTMGARHSFPGVKQPRREADHSRLSSAEFKNGGAISPLPHTSSWRGGCIIKPRVNSTCKDIFPWLYSPCGPWPLFLFFNLYTVGRTPWTGDQPVARPLPLHRTIHTRAQCPSGRIRFMPFFFNLHSGGGFQTGSTRHVGHLLAYCTGPG